MSKSSRTLELTLKVVVAASQELQRLKSELQELANIQGSSAAAKGIAAVGEAAERASVSVETIRKGVFGLGGLTGSLAAIATGFGAISGAIQTATGFVQQFYGATIGAAEALNAQLLSSQTNLASATRIFQGGIEITDPTAKINATRQSLEQALQTIQKETQSLVGVTSSQVNELFQITLQNAAELNNQAKGLDASLNDPIKAATTLTKGWAASLKVIGVPLNQASQEINSILKGTIDQNSILAKNLKINSAQVNQWKSQGTLVTEISKRLETFVAGNAIAANSIDGIFSNIQDYFELFAREFGKPLLQPIIDALAAIFQLIDTNKESIFGLIRGIGEALGSVLSVGLQASVAVIAGLFNTLMGVIGAIAPVVQALGAAFSVAFSMAQAALKPVVDLLAAIINSPIGQFIGQILAIGTAIAAVVAGIAVIGPAVAGIGTAIAGATTAIGGFLAAFAPIAALVTATFGAIGAVVSTVGAALQQFFALIVQGLSPAFEPLQQLAQLIQIVASAILSAIGQQAIAALQLFGNVVKSVFDGIIAVISPVAGLIKDIFLGAFSLIGEALTGIVSAITNTIKAIIDNPAFQAIAKTIGVDIDEVKRKVEELGKAGQDAGQQQAAAAKQATDELRFQAQALTELGNSYEQLKNKAENAQRAIADGGGGDPERFKKAAEELIKITQQQIELGQISEADAQKRLNAIANDTRIEVSIQQSAQDAITKIREQGNKRDLEAIEQQIKAVESQIKRREIAEVTGTQRITELKRQQLQQQLQDVEEAIAAEQQAIASGSGSKTRLDELSRQQADLQRQLKDQAKASAEEIAKAETTAKQKELATQKANLDQHLAEVELARANGTLTEEQAAVKITEIKRQQLQIQLQDIQAQLEQARALNDPTKVAQLEAQAAQVRTEIAKQATSSQKQLLDAKLKDFEEKEKRATDAVKLAEAERKAEIDKQVAAGTISREQAESKKLALTKQSIQKEIEAERKKIAIIAALQAKTPDARKEKDARLLESRKRLAELTSRLAENEIAQQEKLKQAAQKAQEDAEQRQIKAIEERARAVQNQFTAQKIPLQAQLGLLDTIAKAIANQNALLSAQKDLIAASSSLMQTQYDTAIALAGSEEEANQLRLEQAQAEYQALQQGFEVEKLSLKIEQQKTQILLEQEKIRLRIQQIEAQSALAEAKATVQKLKAQGASKEEIKAAELSVQSSKDKVDLLTQAARLQEEQAAITQETFKLQNQALEKRQQQQSLQARTKIAKLTDSTEDDNAIRQEAIASARQSRFDISQQQSAQANTQRAFLSRNEAQFQSVLPDLKQPAAAIGQQGKAAPAPSQIATLAPMSSFNIFVESGKEAKLGKQIGTLLFQSFSNVIKQAASGKTV